MPSIPKELALIISLTMGLLSSYIAKKRGKNPYTWFFCGFFFGLLGVALFYFFSSKKAEEVAPEISPKPLLKDPLSDKMWYYLDQNMNQTGPISYSALTQARDQGLISNDTYIWNADFDDWKLLQDVLPNNRLSH